MSASSAPRLAWWIWIVGFFLILLIHLIWELLNETPPVWDMAHHQRMGWAYLMAWRDGTFWNQLADITTYYPPLYYLQESLLLSLLSQSQFLALLSNLPGLFLLSFFTFRLADRMMAAPVAALSGLVVLLLPLISWTSRESLLDVSVSGWVLCAHYLVLKSDFFSRRGWTLLLAPVMAAGLLTKWSFGFFFAGPVIFGIVASARRREAVKNLIDTLLLAFPLVAWWYLPNISRLMSRFGSTQEAAVLEKDPLATSWLGWIYYPRSLSSYYLFLPLTLLLLYSLIWIWKKRKNLLTPDRLVLWSVVIGFLILTFLPTKDPRYLMPAIGLVVILLFRPFAGRVVPALFLSVFAFLQFLAISFDFPVLPEKLAFFQVKDDVNYTAMAREWVIFQSHYFHITGPPRRQDWHLDDILEAVPDGSVLGFVPDMPFFHPGVLDLWAVRKGAALQVIRVGQSQASVDWLKRLDWVVGKTGNQGISYITQFNSEVYAEVKNQNWPLAASWELPDQSRVLLWRNPSPSQ